MKSADGLRPLPLPEPEASLPEASLPEASLPEASLPEASLPEALTPPPPPPPPPFLAVALAAERRASAAAAVGAASPAKSGGASSPGRGGGTPSPGKAGAAKPQWKLALEYRVWNLPSVEKAHERVLLPFSAKTGRLCADNCCNRGCDPCSEGVVSDFAPFGSATTSYFKLLKGLALLFFLLSCLAMPALVINTFGVTAAGAQAQVLAVAVTTLGNLPSNSVLGNLTDPTITLPYKNAQLPVTEAISIYAALDFVSVVAFFLFWTIASSGLAKEDAQVKRLALGAEMYTIFLPSVPPGTTEEMLREWARVVSTSKRSPGGFEVADVNIVDDNMGLLRIFRERGMHFRKLARINYDMKEVAVKIGDRQPYFCASLFDREYRRLWALETSMASRRGYIAHLNASAKTFRSHGATAAFVTFESTAAPTVVLEKFPPSTIAWCCQSRAYFLNGQRVAVREAPKAGSVLWPNLNIKGAGRCLRQTITFVIAAALILASFVFIVQASIYQSAAQKAMAPADCSSPGLLQSFANGTYTSADAATFPPSSLVFKCFCDTQVTWSSFDSAAEINAEPWAPRCPDRSCFAMITKNAVYMAKQEYCASYIKGRSIALGLTIGMSLSIALVNFLLARCMRAMSAFEGHSSVNDLEVALVLRLFVAQFTNTALLPIIINAAWDTVTGRDLPIPNTGLYDDFSAGWYKSVGAGLISTMILQVFSPHILPAFRMCRMRAKIATATEKMALGAEVPSFFKTQADLNETFVGGPMDFAASYAAMLNVVFVCFIFSAGMPLLMPIAFVALVAAFNMSKATYLYYAQRQSASVNTVARTVASMLPYAGLMHLGVAIWMLGSVRIFRTSLLGYVSSVTGASRAVAALQARSAEVTARTGILSTGLQRLSTPQTVPLVVLFAFLVLFVVVRFVLYSLGRLAFLLLNLLLCGCLDTKRCKGPLDVRTPPYSVAASDEFGGTRKGIMGVRSYSILDNPAMQRMFGISQEFAATHKGLASVAAFTADDALEAAEAQANADVEEADDLVDDDYNNDSGDGDDGDDYGGSGADGGAGSDGGGRGGNTGVMIPSPLRVVAPK
jgi:uncharacterized membrane protein YgcG